MATTKVSLGLSAQKSLPGYLRPTIASSMRTVSKSRTLPAAPKQRTILPVQLRGGVVPQGAKKAMAKAGVAATPRQTLAKMTKVTTKPTALPKAPVEGPETAPGKLAALSVTTAETAETTAPAAPVEGPETASGKLVVSSAATTTTTTKAPSRKRRPRARKVWTLGDLVEIFKKESPRGALLVGKLGVWQQKAQRFLARFPEQEKRKKREKKVKNFRNKEGHFAVRKTRLETVEEGEEEGEQNEGWSEEGTVIRGDFKSEDEGEYEEEAD
ncbi:hypothetical protein TWF106_000756 [Orbilia oligospora]|uniref:Uncharacterized protein n=1 Tax=Orbilia oligospora TaxID=2813651 RepID=A0A6G1MBC7_ORBOL|nr:hypothetical protein TWF106_000756 [Orbilia oligospora]KAF3226714.1 hypothetical protein TWF191_004537 [Orbilia oligospora]KAF3250750.1 hypothetical protein TWF192_005189 [Orbilia oligospora]